MKTIPLTRGYVALVDDDDFEWLNQFKWHTKVCPQPSGLVYVYAARNIYLPNGRRTLQSMHRFIVGVFDRKIEVDHEDHNTVNNQRHNLRVGVKKDNNGNRLKYFGVSKFKGVYWHKRERKWRAQISKGKSQNIGSFTSEIEAAKAYDRAAVVYFGKFALTNKKLGLLPD